MPFYCGKRSAGICVVLGSKQSSTYSSEYASGSFESAASHLPAPPLPRDEGLLGQTPSPLKTSASFVLGHSGHSTYSLVRLMAFTPCGLARRMF